MRLVAIVKELACAFLNASGPSELRSGLRFRQARAGALTVADGSPALVKQAAG